MVESTVDMTDRVVLVTGGTDGIGKETATALARMGAKTIVVGRNEERGQTAVDEIIESTGNESVTFRSADLSSLEAVRALAVEVRDGIGRLDVLVNNAGALSAERQETVDGYERTFAMNVLSPYLLTHELLALLSESEHGRIVNVNTGSFDLPWPFDGYATPDFDDLQLTSGYTGMKAYVRSKTANLLWTYELARRLEAENVSVYAVNPGGAATDMQRESMRASPLPLRLLMTALGPLMKRFMNTGIEEAAYSSVYAASAPELADETGVYLDPDGEIGSSASVSRDEVRAKQLWSRISTMTGIEPDAPRTTPLTEELPV